MFSRLLKGFTIVAVFAALMFAMAPAVLASHGADDQGGDTSGGSGHGGSEMKAKGSIAAIDLAAGSITVSDKRTGALITILADSSTEIRKNNNHNALLSDLAIGDRVDARFDRTTFVARRIVAKSAKVEGTLTAVDLAANTVTITPLGGSPVVLNVTAATKIERNEMHVSLSALVIGDAAEAKFDATTMNASKVETTGL